jgi:GAF domain-containing protein
MTEVGAAPQVLSASEHNRTAVKQIIQCVEDSTYCALLGPRFCGKTELLRFVQTQLARDPMRVCIYVNLHEVEASTQAGFFTSLANITAQRIVERCECELPTLAANVASSATFRNFLIDGVAPLKRNLVLMIDHLEGVPSDLVQALLTSLRAAYMEQQPDGHRLVAVVCGALSLATLAVGETSPFRGIARRVFVGDLTEGESATLIARHVASHRIRVSQAARAWLLRATQGDPQLIARICQKLIQIADGSPSQRLTVHATKQVVHDFICDEAPRYSPLREAIQLIEEDPDLLHCALLLLGRDSPVPKRELHLPLSPDLDPLYLTGVVREVHGDSYQVRNGIYRQFLAQHFDPGRVGHLLTMAGRWDSAIDYLETSISGGNDQFRSDLLAATINSIYACEDLERAAYYLKRGLSATFGVKRACIWHISERGDFLSLIEQVGSETHGTPPLSQTISVGEDRLEARAYREKLFLRGQEDDKHVKRAMPLFISGRKPIGVVTICDDQGGDELVGRHERDLQLVGYLSQAARAIQEVNTRQHQREEERRQRQLAETLREISGIIGRSLNLEQVLEQILEQMARVLSFNTASIQLVTPDSSALRIIASRGFDDPAKVEELLFPLDDAYPNVRVWRAKAPQRYFDVRELFPHFAEPKYQASRVRSWLGAPLLAGDNVIGVITLDSFTPDFYTPEHEKLALVFAGQAAIAIENARLFEAEFRQREVAEMLRDLVVTVNSTLDLGQILNTAVQRLQALHHATACSVSFLEKDGKTFLFRATTDPGLDVSRRLTFPADGSIAGRAIREHKVQIVNNLDEGVEHRAAIARRTDVVVHSMLTAPLFSNDKPLGVIQVLNASTNAFTEADGTLLATTAALIETAVARAQAYTQAVQLAEENADLFVQAEQRAKQLTVLHDLDRAVAVSLRHIADVYHALACHAPRLLACDYLSITLLDGEQMRVTYVAGEDQTLPPVGAVLPIKTSAVARVVAQNQPLVRHNIAADARFFEDDQLVAKGIQSGMIIPLQVKGQVIGTWNIYSKQVGAYGPNDLEIGQSMADQVAMAIENTRLYEQLGDRARVLEGLLAGSRTLTERIADRPRVVLDKIAEIACKMMNAPCAVVYPYRADTKSYDARNVGRYGLRKPNRFFPKDRIREYGVSLTANIIKRGRRIVENVNIDLDQELKHARFIQREEILAFIGEPLKVGAEPVGALFVSYRAPHSFSDDEKKTIEILGNHAAIAILNARLYQQTSEALQKRIKEMETVQEIDDAITSTLDLREILEMILDRALQLTGASHGTVKLIAGEDGQWLELVAERGASLVSTGERLKLGEGVTGKAAQEGRTYRIPDIRSLEWAHIYRAYIPGMRSELAVPMRFEKQVVGVINIESANTDAFNEDDEHLLEGLAKQAAIAIRNARLYEATRRQSEHWQALCEATKAITASFAAERRLSLDRIAKQAVERITGVEGPKAVWGAILLYDEANNELQFESVYPPTILPDFDAGPHARWSLDKDKAPNGRIGITGRTILEKRQQRVKDVLTDPDYLEFMATTRSELDIPLLDGDKIIGVLSVESDQVGAFDEYDEQALEGLAELAVIAAKNAEQAEQLSRTKAVAVMGAWGADVVHDINREVGAIRRSSFLLQQRSDLAPEVKKQLANIDRYAEALALPQLPVQPLEPGHALELPDAPLLDNVVQAEVERLQPAYPSVSWHCDLQCPGVRAAMHEQWLRRVLRHLIHNAVKAIPPGRETPLVSIRTTVADAMTEIELEDNGKGVRPEIKSMLFQRPIPHEDGRQGQGLLLVGFLVEQHGGEAKLVWSRTGEGSCFAFSIPLARSAGDCSKRDSNIGQPMGEANE